MRLPLPLFVFPLVLLLGIPETLATNLLNQDRRSYDIVLRGSSSTVRTHINGLTTRMGICAHSADACRVTILGLAATQETHIEVRGDQDIIIRNGAVKVE